MGVSAGYKQTEVGVIPEDWAVRPLNTIAKVTSGKRLPLGYFVGDKETPYPYIRVTDMRPGRVDTTDIKYVPEAAYPPISKYRIFKEDLFISVAGTLGIVGAIPDELDGANLTENADRISAITCDKNYLLHVMLSPVVQGVIESEQTVGAQPKLALIRIRNFAIPLPPTLEEQRAIAAALSDVDALLDGLDGLIAKKREVRNATKRQLLAGQTRLPGFKDQWEESSFANVVRHHAGNSTLIKGKLPSSEAAGLYPAYSASGQDVWCAHFEHEGNAVVVSAVGSRCGKAFAASGKWSAIANTHVVWPLTSKIDPDFLGFFINDENFWLKSGTGQPFVLFTQTFARPLLLPSLKEQTAIARVLSDMDAELTTLEARRDKTKNLKKAMMQELLTGKTRLVNGGARV